MSQELKYTAPVRVGDVVKAVGKVTKVRELLDMSIFLMHSIQVHAKKPVCTMDITVYATPDGSSHIVLDIRNVLVNQF